MRLASLALALLLSTPAHAEPLLLRGGAIWTGDPARPSAQAILVEGEKIAAVGTDAEVEAVARKRKQKPKVIELAGRRVLPGIIDSHIHVVGGGLQLDRVDLNPAKTKAEVHALIKQYAAAHPGSGWILGRGWAYDLWKPGLPTRQELDAVMPDRPVFVRAYDGHTGWANSKALQMAGIDERTPDPKDGKILREGKTQKPSGALLEGAMGLLWAKIPKPSMAEKRRAIVRAGEHAAAHGLTTMCEVGGDLADLDVYEALDAERRLPVRVVFGPSIDDGIERYAARRKALLARPGSGLLTPGPLKGFVDGVIESGTANMISAFGDGTPSDKPLLTPAVLLEQIGHADLLGIDVAYHAIGDLAVRSVLDAVEQIEKAHPARERRPRIEHIEVVDAADLPRFRALGVIPSMMPMHADPGVEEDGGIYVKRLGPERLQRSFAFADLRKAGAALAFGSDWPVVTLEPLPAIAMAVTRTRPDGHPKGGYVAKQAVSMDEALHGYTTRAAFATRLEQTTGALVVGKAADLIVLDPSAKLEQPTSLFKAKVDLTIVAGKVVYERR